MKSFSQFLIENYERPHFIFAIDEDNELVESHAGHEHTDAFPHLFGGPNSISDFPRVWGRTEDGVVSLVTENGHEPAASSLRREGKRISRFAIEDTFHRINAVKKLKEHYPDSNLLFRSPRFPPTFEGDRRPNYHTADQHIKHLMSLISDDM